MIKKTIFAPYLPKKPELITFTIENVFFQHFAIMIWNTFCADSPFGMSQKSKGTTQQNISK